MYLYLFFFNDTATTEIYTLSLHDALPISRFQIAFLFRDAKQCTGLSDCQARAKAQRDFHFNASLSAVTFAKLEARSEEHTSELQSRPHLVCRLLLEKKKACMHSRLSVRMA